MAALAPADAVQAPRNGKEVAQPREFDRRSEEHAKKGAIPASFIQNDALAALRAKVSDLAVAIDPDSGVTRSLSNRGGYLTDAADGTALQIGLGFLEEHLDALGITSADVSGAKTINEIYTRASGANRASLQQYHRGIPVYNGFLTFNVNRDGKIISVKSTFQADLAGSANRMEPVLGARQAIDVAAEHLGLGTAGELTSIAKYPEATQRERFLAPELSLSPIEASLYWLPITAGEARLVWSVNVETLDYDHSFIFNIDAENGKIWTRGDLVDDATYRVYPSPQESPDVATPVPPADGRTEVTDPHDTDASPFGWHDTNGAAGAEFTVTRGNNTHSWADRDANEAPPTNTGVDFDAQCGASLDCDFAINLSVDPTNYQHAAVANLFYWTNFIHDVEYLYGFDEASKNFQVNNYGNGGTGNDDVMGLAQAKTGTTINCNANFLTPADGSRPRMRMYECNEGTPQHDGDLDNLVITHEYGHGISNRIINNSSSVTCMQNSEQPGEGTSDWWGLSLTMRPTDVGTAPRGVGNYLLAQPPTGPGIRTDVYSTDNAQNNWTYANVNGSVVPHGVGEKWAQAYWEVTWALIDKHGFEADLRDFTGTSADAGNIRAKFYIIEGLKNTVCSPGFVDVRDGIIEAATDNYGGVDVCTIWEAFAAYGLGSNASQGSSSSSTDQTAGFNLPNICSFGNAGTDARVCAGTAHVQSVLVGPAYTNPPVDMSVTGNPAGTTAVFSEDPVSGPLPETITLTIGNTGAVAAGTYTINVTGIDTDSPANTATDSFDLTVDAGTPAVPTLVSPINGTSGYPVRPQFQWNAVAGALDYDLQVDDNADFSSPAYQATAITGTTHTATSDLPNGVLLYWRVRASNTCGDGLQSAANRFVTSLNGTPVNACFDTAIAIPDGNTGGVTNNQTVAASAVIGDLDVRVTMQPDHTWIGDLTFRLTKGATVVTIVDRPGVPVLSTVGCNANLDVVTLSDEAPTPFENPAGCNTTSTVINGSFSPSNPLTAFDGLNVNGAWSLFASDAVLQDTGTIDEWCLIYSTPDAMPFLDSFETNNTTRWSATTP